jgi:hypothetical protein
LTHESKESVSRKVKQTLPGRSSDKIVDVPKSGIAQLRLLLAPMPVPKHSTAFCYRCHKALTLTCPLKVPSV